MIILFLVSILSNIISIAYSIDLIIKSRSKSEGFILQYSLPFLVTFLSPLLITHLFNFSIWMSLILVIGIGIKFTYFFSNSYNESVSYIMETDNCEHLRNPKLEDLIVKMCLEQGINKIDIDLINNSKEINAQASSKLRSRQHQISITKKSLDLEYNTVIALVAHEIFHLKFMDTTVIANLKRVLNNLCLFVSFIVFVQFLNFISEYLSFYNFLTLIFCLIALLYFILMMIFLLIDNRRFWNQIQELKADRFASQLSNVGAREYIKLLHILKSQEDYHWANYTWYQKIYFKYFLILDHPSIDRRIYLIENYKKWTYMDLTKHLFLMMKWFLTGKGWIGR
ncbi:M48 family metalloprotease [Paenibacillus kyungheensis]|uniref:M48 family metalloprotease n=1 Tax=Paenibacillus kyungheensis TaxID=1452732 RepID=A0AAX3M5A6_9BACL|nr:M48 family metalloprotease [Paenibacillus kyungheensis]WCT57437.1 M48 family metalloprotease [Paenibacillus kyungheensis]